MSVILLVLYTPGHGLFMDTLIMYAIASSLRGQKVGYTVKGHGGSYVIEAETELEALAKNLVREAHERREGVVNLLTERTRTVQRASRAKLARALDRLCDEEDVVNYLCELEKPAHAVSEGRGKGGFPVWLPINPSLGKYLTAPFKYRAKSYATCPFCVGLSALGFHVAGIPLRVRVGRGGKLVNITNVVLLAFDGDVDNEPLNVLLEFLSSDNTAGAYERLSRRVKDVSAIPLTIAALAHMKGNVADVIAHTDASWKALSVVFEVVRITEIRGYNEVVIDPLFDVLAKLYKVGRLDSFQRLIRELLVHNDANSSLDALWRFILCKRGADLYKFVRSCVAAKQLVNFEVCKELTKLVMSG